MGGFYGSVQVRSDDQESVRPALEELAQKKNRKFLLGPALNGWVGIYPDGSGQDLGVAGDLAHRLPGEIIAVLVHDDDIFAYEYYRDGKRVDQYDSVPDYFGEVSEREKQKLRGRPETFAHLASDPAKFEALRGRLAGQAQLRDLFASGLLDEFADALGIRNAVTSYEYLKENDETDDIEGWDQFIHVPDLSHEEAQEREAEAAIVEEKRRLIREGWLLAEHGGIEGWDGLSPWFCPSPDGQGFLVAWSNHADPKEEMRPLERYGPPWSSGPSPTPWAIGSHVFGVELSPSGRYLAVAHAAGVWKAALWDLQENRLVAETSQVRAVNCVGFLPDESAMFSVSAHGEEGRVAITPVDGSDSRTMAIGHAKLAAVHPSGMWLVVVDNLNRLYGIDVASLQVKRTRYVGGRYVPTPMERHLQAQAQEAMAKVDLDAMEQQLRQHQESMLAMFEKGGIPPGLDSIEPLKEQFRQQIDEQIRKMREQFSQTSSPFGRVPEDRGSEGVFRVRFDPSGERLCLATMTGVRVHSWQEVIDADGDLPCPPLSVTAAGTFIETESGAIRQNGYIYDFDFDPDRDRLLFAGLDGRVQFLDLTSGRSGILLEPPTHPPIHRVVLSRDRTTLALIARPSTPVRSAKGRSPILQFWDYAALSRTRP